MPLIKNSGYRKRPWYFFNTHFETIIPSVFNKIAGIQYESERLELPDGDFIDLDWVKKGNPRLLILSHGLEGDTHRHYILRAAKYFSERGWDILAWNNRGCSGEMNRLPRSYHHGDTGDLAQVIEHGLSKDYEQIVLLGISMGGCQTVKYFGEYPVDDRVLGAFTVSVSCDLRDTSQSAEKHLGGFYSKRFLRKVKESFKRKQSIHESLKTIDIDSIDSFDEFHEKITVKYFGFENVDDFYFKSSSINYIDKITKPVFILNALNDPMLGEKCYPFEQADKHPFLYLEVPKHGGHVGFTLRGKEYSYIEERADNFINEVILPSSETSAKPN